VYGLHRTAELHKSMSKIPIFRKSLVNGRWLCHFPILAPVGVWQIAAKPGCLHVQLENRRIYTAKILCCGRQMDKKKKRLERREGGVHKANSGIGK
jgi:hypothetical protein